MAPPVITLTLREKRFGPTPILGALTLSIARHEVIALTGPSGIGKTTLLRILAGLDDQFDGTLQRPARTAMVFQEPTLLPWRCALDNICLATGAAPDTATRLLAEVGLEGRGPAYPGQLSLGQQRRLSFARALAADPDLLLMDEPFVSLDAVLVEEMLQLTERLLAPRSTATVIVTHAEAEAHRLATRILRLEGKPARIISEHSPMPSQPGT